MRINGSRGRSGRIEEWEVVNEKEKYNKEKKG